MYSQYSKGVFVKDNYSRLKILTIEKAKITKPLENIMYAIENGLISATANKRLHNSKNSKKIQNGEYSLKKRKRQLKCLKVSYVNITDKRQNQNRKIQINFNSPIKLNSDKSDCADRTSGFFFYRDFKKMSYTLHGSNAIRKIPILIALYVKQSFEPRLFIPQSA